MRIWLLAGTLLGSMAQNAAAQDLSTLFQAPDGTARRVSSANHDGDEDFVKISPGAEATLAELGGPGVITHLSLAVECLDPYWSRMLVLRARWDDEEQPSVEVPVGDFFAMGHGAEVDVQSNPVQVTGDGRALSCYWPMPFSRSAEITLRNDSHFQVQKLFFGVDWLEKVEDFPAPLRTFHASYRQSPVNDPASSFRLAELRGTGHYVGTVLSIFSLEDGWSGEGDDRFFIDGDTEPTLLGSGLEDYFSSSGGFRRGMGPFAGVSLFDGDRTGSRTTAFRWHLRDPIPFLDSMVVAFERRGWALRGDEWKLVGDRADRLAGVAFWYQVEPHAGFRAMPGGAERLPFLESRIEFEDDPEILEVLEGSPRPEWQDGRRFACGAMVVHRPQKLSQARVRCPFEVSGKRRHTLWVRWATGPRSPQVEVHLDGKRIAGPFELYSAEPGVHDQLLATLELEEGEHVVEFRAVGAHALSAGFELGLDSWMARFSER